ncbi:MAG TPA: tryptophan synthase subunit beta [Candidatus Limnocylindrales bacterium]
MTIAVRGSGIVHDIALRRAADLAAQRPVAREVGVAPEPRPLLPALARPGLHVIAEVKRRSPSVGTLAADDDVIARARAYEQGGAAAISVLCEPHWFNGSVDDLRAVRAAVRVPVLAKDFIVSKEQLASLRDAGADLVLLLAVLHRSRDLRALVREARSLGLEPFVEAHGARELDRALASDAKLIGINNRDLKTLDVDVRRADSLRSLVPDDRLVVAESGVSDPQTLIRWRALGFDAALIGEALMRSDNAAAATAAFVAAGRIPEDLAAADRQAEVKICGLVDENGIRAAMSAGVDSIGLNVVAGTPRALTTKRAATLARYARSLPGRAPRVVLVTADATHEEMASFVSAIDPDVVQISGNEVAHDLTYVKRETWKVVRTGTNAHEALAQARTWIAAGCERILVDAAHGNMLGGTGHVAERTTAALIAREIPVTLAGGLRPDNVASALREVSAIGVDVASGVEQADTRPPLKDPLAVALFTKRARAARVDLPHAPARPERASAGLLNADRGGRWGTHREFGGRYVPETLVPALLELEQTYYEVRNDPSFWAELRELSTHFAGRPTPIYPADRLARALGTRVRIYLKREDLALTGAHKINNVLGQGLLAKRLGKTRLIAETGAGQHGVATATVAALLGLPCVVYMGARDIERQRPNVLRMETLGAQVRPVETGSATLKDAINDAMRDWVTNVSDTYYVLGSAMGPHPYPTIVRDMQRVIGDEAAAQMRNETGRLPDAVVACVGGGSNAIGIFSRFIGEEGVRLVAVEAAGDGIETGRHAAALAGGGLGIIHGARTMLLQDADGQVQEAHSISAGLDYPGVGPQLAALSAEKRLELRSATDSDALAAMRQLAACEGILPALESAHALAALPGLVEGLVPGSIVLVGLSGRGDKDVAHLTSPS